jgi:tetratricopeptide (TPR) repeat protein
MNLHASLAITLLISAAAGMGLSAAARSAPRIPNGDAAVLETLPGRPGDPAQRELRRLRADLAANPGDPVRAIALARHHFAIAQASGDPRHIGYAEAALSGIAEDGATRTELFIVRAQLAQYLHDFPKALALLERALASEPEDPEALAWKIAVHMVQSDYAAARRACERLARVVSELLGAGCGAQVAAATGALKPAYARLQRTLAGHPQARPSLRQWVSVLLADMAQRLGDARAADAHYRAAFAADAPDQYLLAAYAEFLIDERPRGRCALPRGLRGGCA